MGFLRKWFGADLRDSEVMAAPGEGRRRIEMIRAGNAAEELALDFEAARPMLRLCTLRQELVPSGDVSVPGIVPSLSEVVALDAGRSVRYLSKQLLDSWGVALDEVVQAAREGVQALALSHDDRAWDGHPGFRSLSTADGSPVAGALAAQLDKLEPEALGLFGTLIGLPSADGFFYRALNDADNLRADLALVSMFTVRLFSECPNPAIRLLQLPLWRRRDGTFTEVAFTFSEQPIAVEGSALPAMEGVLTALDPLAELAVPDWARTVLTPAAYTRFAGCVSAVLGCRPAQVGELGDQLALREPAVIVAGQPVDDWPVVLEQFLRDVVRPPQEPSSVMTWLEPLRDPANDARLAAILSEPGLSAAEAARLLAIIRAVVDELVDRGLILPELTPRSLVDLARLCHGKPADDWQRLIAEELGQSGNQAAELDRLTAGPWVDAAKHLWAFLHPQTWQPPAGSGLVPIQEEVLPGVFWRPVLHSSGPRARPLLRHMLEAWEVGTESVRAQASRIVLAYEHVVEPWPDPGSPLRIIRTRDREAEWLGLLLHRLPDACPAGHVVAIPFRSGAIHLPLDAPDLLAVLPRFASLAAGAFREASQYNDQLCRSLFWLQPDGTPLELFDLFKVPDRPTELPEAFLVALASQQPTSRRPT